MNKIMLIYFLMLLSSMVHAQHAGYKAVEDSVEFRKEFVKTAKKIQTIKCDFIQDKNLSMLSEKITSTGKFWYKKENMVRMEYKTPYKYLLVINKKDVTIIDDKKTSTMSSGSSKIFRQISRITVDCVRGTVFSNPDFKIKVFESNASYLIEMTPVTKEMKEFFRTINIEVDKSDYSVNNIDMLEISGDNTLITFQNKALNTEISDALFFAH